MSNPFYAPVPFFLFHPLQTPKTLEFLLLLLFEILFKGKTLYKLFNAKSNIICPEIERSINAAIFRFSCALNGCLCVIVLATIRPEHPVIFETSSLSCRQVQQK